MGKKPSNKVHLVFDEEKRREFLTGFRKRKLLRKKHAKDEFEKALKEERKRIKAESREQYKKLVASNRDIPGLESLMEEEYQDENATVKIITLSKGDIAEQNNWIGENRPKYLTDESEVEEEIDKNDEEVPGMELSNKISKNKPVKKEFDTEKNLKKKLKNMATKRVQKSKVFQKKNKLERDKQRKKSSQQRKFKEKANKKSRHVGKKNM